MKFRILLPLVITLFFVIEIAGQTESELARATKPVKQFATKQLLINAEFDKNGQICSAILQPNRYFENKIMLGSDRVTSSDIEGFLNLFVSEKDRGKRTKVWGDSGYFGQISETYYEYENLRILLWNGIHPQDFMSGDSRAESKIKDSSETAEGQFESAEVVEISWQKRECPKQ